MTVYWKDGKLIYKDGKLGMAEACCCDAPTNCCLALCASEGTPETIEFSPGSYWATAARLNALTFCKCVGGPDGTDPRTGLFHVVRVLSQLTAAPTTGCVNIDNFGNGFPCVWRYHADDVCGYPNNFLEPCVACRGTQLDFDIQVRKIPAPDPGVEDYCYLECMVSLTGACSDGVRCHYWKWVPYPVDGWWSNDSCSFTLVLDPDDCGDGDVQWQDANNPGTFFKNINTCTTCYVSFLAGVGDLIDYPKITITG